MTAESAIEDVAFKPLVAVVDDDGVIVDSLAEALEDAGFTPLGHTSPEPALAAFLGDGPRPEVFLLDLVMPGMDGIALCRRLRAESSLAESTIVIMTGQVAQERLDAEILRAMEAGADDYLVKPFGTGEFIARMHAWLRTGRARRNADRARLRSEARYRALYESTRDAVMLLNARGFFDCNDATVRIFGCRDKAEFCRKHPADLSPPRQPDGADSLALAGERIAEAMARGSLFFEWMHRRQDTGADFPAEVLLSALELDGRRVLQALVRDISERKRDDDALRACMRSSSDLG